MLNLSIGGDGNPHPARRTGALYSNERVGRSAKKDFGDYDLMLSVSIR